MKKPHPDIMDFFKQSLQLIIPFKKGCPRLFENPQWPVAELLHESPADIIWPQPVAKFETKDSRQSSQDLGEPKLGNRLLHNFLQLTMSF